MAIGFCLGCCASSACCCCLFVLSCFSIFYMCGIPILITFYVVPVPYHSIDLLLARDLPVATVDLEN